MTFARLFHVEHFLEGAYMQYLISTAVLIFTLAIFFVLAPGRFRNFGKAQWVLRVVIALPLFVSSIGHFTRTAVFSSIVPPMFSHPEFWVGFTGVLELVGAIGLLIPITSKYAAVGIALLMIAVFPANVYAAHRTIGGLPMPSVPVRLAMQVVYILLVLLAGWGIPTRARAS